jgi:ribA/ribD-fused uncharacterized protein
VSEPINGFFGQYNFLSNFYKHEAITYEGMTAVTVEHLFQAIKTLDPQERKMVLKAESPGEAKKLGQKVTLRPDWEKAKIRLMTEILKVKFSIPRLKKKLLATGDAYLEETNDWGDHFWGANKKGYGKNWLGKCLMEIRKDN